MTAVLNQTDISVLLLDVTWLTFACNIFFLSVNLGSLISSKRFAVRATLRSKFNP